MKAIILAAGRGSRLGYLTDDKPKCLTELKGKTLLQWQIEAIKNAGINDIAIVRGYNKEKIDVEGANYFDNEKWHSTNMVISLCCADEWLVNDECIVSYSDIVYDTKVISSLINDKNDICITYKTDWLELWQSRFDEPLSDAETFKVDTNGRLIEIGNRAKTLEDIKGQYMGLLKFTPVGWKRIKQYLSNLDQSIVDKLDMTSLLNGLIKTGNYIFAIPTNGLWLEVDSQSDLKLYKSWIE